MRPVPCVAMIAKLIETRSLNALSLGQRGMKSGVEILHYEGPLQVVRRSGVVYPTCERGRFLVQNHEGIIAATAYSIWTERNNKLTGFAQLTDDQFYQCLLELNGKGKAVKPTQENRSLFVQTGGFHREISL